jgi:hypothetical protein
MKKYEIEYIGLITIDANSDKDAYDKFDAIDNETIGKNVYRSDILNSDDLDDE